MALLAAPLLYVMPEPEAFHCFRILLTEHVPQYVRRYAGARRGCHLLDRCLADVDPDLHALFAAHNLNAEVYAFSSLSSLGSCVQPISDTVRLWDVQLAFGSHMHIIFTLARLVLASPSIRASSADTAATPMITRELEQGLGFDAETVLARAVPLVNELMPDLYEELVDHGKKPPPDEFSSADQNSKGDVDESPSPTSERQQRGALRLPDDNDWDSRQRRDGWRATS
jgi:cell cycle arrest protein BUB2